MLWDTCISNHVIIKKHGVLIGKQETSIREKVLFSLDVYLIRNGGRWNPSTLKGIVWFPVWKRRLLDRTIMTPAASPSPPAVLHRCWPHRSHQQSLKNVWIVVYEFFSEDPNRLWLVHRYCIVIRSCTSFYKNTRASWSTRTITKVNPEPSGSQLLLPSPRARALTMRAVTKEWHYVMTSCPLTTYRSEGNGRNKNDFIQ